VRLRRQVIAAPAYLRTMCLVDILGTMNDVTRFLSTIEKGDSHAARQLAGLLPGAQSGGV